jgi:hypothetical protein
MKLKTRQLAAGVAAGFSLTAGGLAAARIRSQRRVGRIWSALELPSRSERFRPEMVDGLPEPARRYLLHAIQPGTRLARSVRLDITGSIRLARDATPLPMISEEMLAPPLGYVWRARVGKGALRFSGFDVYAEGWGEMRWWMAGLVPIVRSRGSDLVRSAVGRLLGEAIFIPSVLLPSDEVRWEPVDDSSARVRLVAGGEEVKVTLEVDGDGRLLRAAFARWNGDPRIGPVGYVRFASEGFAEERTFSGYTIPTRFESGWQLGDADELRFFFGKIELAEFTL